MFASAFIKIDFVKLILNKNELNVKWFLFKYNYVVMDLTINLKIKSIV